MSERAVNVMQPKDIVPLPDPTLRTNEQLAQAIAGLKELFQTENAGLKERFQTEITAMKEAVKLLQANADKTPTLPVAFERIDSNEKVNDERFAKIDKQFQERDTRTEQTSRDNKVAIDAALQAQKEAVAKSEVGFTKQIDNIMALIASQVDAANGKIDDVKTRLTLIEGSSKGRGDIVGWIFGLVGMLVAIGTLLAVVLRNNAN